MFNGKKMWSPTLAVLVILVGGGGLVAQSGTTELVSVSIDATDINSDSIYSAISQDGKFVAFATAATNAFPDDQNGTKYDVVLRDLEGAASILISQSSAGVQGDGSSLFPAISGDGLLVAFESTATNLVDPDTNGTISDIFLRDLDAGLTTLVSVNANGEAGNGESLRPAISSDGRYVAFISAATNLDVDVTDTNPGVDVFVRDLVAGTTRLVSVTSNETSASGNASGVDISDDGNRVAFATLAPLTVPASADNNDKSDIYLRDLAAGTTTLISRRAAGDRAANGRGFNPAISSDGSLIAFDSNALDMLPEPLPEVRRIYVFDVGEGEMSVVSKSSTGALADARSESPSISADGRFVCFRSEGRNLVPGDTNGFADAFMFDRTTSTTTRLSVATDGTEGNNLSEVVFFSASQDASVVAFRSKATNLAPGTPTRNRGRIYVRRPDKNPPAITCSENISVECSGTQGTVVNFTVTATDDEDPDVTVRAVPPSGSAFPVGTTTVECIAIDRSGNFDTCSFDVIVSDTTAPQIQCPDPIIVPCSGTGGSTVDFEVVVTDNCDPSPVLVVEPPSGSVFTGGETTVACTVTDAAGLQAECSFTVTVLSDVSVFVRGDSNEDDRANVSDAVFTLRYLFAGAAEPACLDAADTDDDGTVAVTDAVYLLQALYQKGPAVPPPGAREAGPDPTDDELSCGSSNC